MDDYLDTGSGSFLGRCGALHCPCSRTVKGRDYELKGSSVQQFIPLAGKREKKNVENFLQQFSRVSPIFVLGLGRFRLSSYAEAVLKSA